MRLALALVLALGCRSSTRPPEPAPAEDPSTPTSSTDPAPAPASRGCVSETGCPDAKPLPACDDAVADTITAVELANQWDALDGQTVHVLDRLQVSMEMCTELYCGPEATCCNTCGGHLTFSAIRDLYLGEGSGAYTCSGDDSGLCCDWQVPDRAARVTGRVGKDAYGFQHLYDPVVCVPAE